MTRIYNATPSAITIITELDSIRISSKYQENVKVPQGAVFNAPDKRFYVKEEGRFYAKTEHCLTNADIEIYSTEL